MIPALVVIGLLPAPTAPREKNTVAPPSDACTVPRGKSGREQDAVAKKFMVAAAHPLAVEAGCRILAKGGRAADAAVAVQAVLAVVEPHASGLTGGTLINYWDPDKQQLRFFDGYSRAPMSVTENLRTPTEQERKALRTDRFPESASATGRAFGVPGTLRVLSDVHSVYGTLPWDQLFDDAIRLAADGFPMSPNLHDGFKERFNGRKRCNYPDLRPRYCNGDEPKPVGTKLYNREIADVLREVRDRGADAFYDPNGKIAPAIVQHAAKGPIKLKGNTAGPPVIPSLMTPQDFADYEPVERTEVCRKAFDVQVCTSPPPAFGGVAVLEMLGLLERGQVGKTDPNSDDRLHLSIEASRLANLDRRAYVGDPDYHGVPVEGLLDRHYLDQRFSLFSTKRAIQPIEPGIPPGAPTPTPAPSEEPATVDVGDPTSNVSIVDADGNAASMTTTNNSHFGSHLEAQGMILNNAMNNFTDTLSVSPGKPVNVMEPKKRPTAAMAPTIVLDGEGKKLKLVVGAAGGSHIPDYVVQTLTGVLVDGMSPAQAINQGHFSGQDLTRKCDGKRGAPSELEAGRRAAVRLTTLVGREHPCPRVIALNSGSTAIEVRGNQLLGAADPRRDGAAAGG
ncbi:gamma-glutamyltransferase 1 Threonine peptidase. MEROPS family T03 [Micromonospora rhizosphaerae]|uniref:Gamma-glutamyltransferase 1 Threonine peptidase. MEROPS family T03 n=1 Tax=Micromonospora rhizosphaerae TaxID=568872 RepID=A0A1C6SE52_9ACTN|nr:gamma-glutamyltransferase family protein [Micromonospora rhizosphaerae]SCL27755.1 gamma-glutamyltransferase 1 Threonine peptidase. MEROPS family T03 [Micromonospora rhizosphaerae]